MILRHFKPEYQKLIFIILAAVLPFAAISSTEEEVSEKQNGVAMRMIGHEVLMCLGDGESRIMPIEKIAEHQKFDSYRISFELDFGFEPDDIISIIERVMTKASVATDYLVEVEQCETEEVVYSFEVRNAANYMIPCQGRTLPKDCYSILITILDGTSSVLSDRQAGAKNAATTADNSSVNSGSPLIPSETIESSLLRSAYLILPLLFLIGFVGFFIKKKNSSLPKPSGHQTAGVDPNLILIGASKFDKKNMALSFEDNKVELSNKETELLSLLHTSVNMPIEREVILQRVWGDEGNYVGRTLDVFISKLRKKLEADASVKIVNIRGVGYKLVMDTPS